MKFLKELCTSKRKLNGGIKVSLGENFLVVIQRKHPPKCKDSSMFTISHIIGNTKFEKVMLNLGVSINFMPHSIYISLNFSPLKELVWL